MFVYAMSNIQYWINQFILEKVHRNYSIRLEKKRYLIFHPNAYSSVLDPQVLIEGSLISFLCVHQWIMDLEHLAKIIRA